MITPPIRLSKRAVGADVAEQFLHNAEYGVLAVNGEYPYAVPLNFVYLNSCIYFHCADDGYKLKLISQNPKVCFTAVSGHKVDSANLTTRYESAVAFGVAETVKGKEADDALKALVAKYDPDNTAPPFFPSSYSVCVVKINITQLTGKANPMPV